MGGGGGGGGSAVGPATGKGKGKVSMQSRLSGATKVSTSPISSGVKSRLATKKSAGEADVGPSSSSEEMKRSKLLARLKGNKGGTSNAGKAQQKASILDRMSATKGAGAGSGAGSVGGSVGGAGRAQSLKKVTHLLLILHLSPTAMMYFSSLQNTTNTTNNHLNNTTFNDQHRQRIAFVV